MSAKEIHDSLLSLAVRGAGLWVLYGASEQVIVLVDDFRSLIAPLDKTWTFNPWDFIYFLVHVLIATYFVLGAPPFLRWATRDKVGTKRS